MLFAAYQHVPNAEFRKYMNQKHDDYYDNINDMVKADYHRIMLKAKTKYDMLLLNKDRPFGTPSDKEQQVIALKAESEQFKDTNFRLSKQLKSKLRPMTSSSMTAPQTNSLPNTPCTSNPITTNQKNTSNRRRQKQDKAWKKAHPSQVTQRQSKETTRHGIGAYTICHGVYTLPTNAARKRVKAS